MGKFAPVGDRSDDLQARPADGRQVGALELLQVLHLVDDDSVQVDSEKVHVLFEEEEIVEDGVVVPADHDEELSPEVLRQG